MSQPPLKRYGRDVEAIWSRHFAHAALLSPRDWTTIERWHAAGIPLAVVSDAIEEIANRKRRGAPPRGLSYVERPVAELWEVVQSGRHQESPLAAPVEVHRALEAWEAAAARAEAPLGEWLHGLVERARAGESVEEALEDGLWERCGDELQAEIVAAVATQLEGHRERMRPELWARTVARNRLRSLRQRLGLPSLKRFT